MMAMTTPAADRAYLAHLEGLGHRELSRPVVAGLDAWYRSALPPDRDAVILDFGCGMGDFLEYLRQRGYTSVSGADTNLEMVAYSMRRVGCVVELIDEIGSYARAHHGEYDCIHLKDVLEHVDKAQTIGHLQLLRTMLKPTGCIIVSGPQMCGFTSLFTLYNDFTHQAIFTQRSLRYVLSAAGYREIRLVRPRLPLTFRPTALTLRVARTLWFAILRLIYMIERPGEEMPPYVGDRIMMTATQGAENDKKQFV
jgi:SAM-dependent methyltransferase